MPSTKDNISEKEFLEKYNLEEFERPSVTVDNILFVIDEVENKNIRKLNEKRLQILLVKRNNHPFLGYWTLPGVFVKMNETLENASIRCLENKAKIKNVYLEQLYSFGDIDRDPRTRVISISYMGLLDKKSISLKETEEDISWFTIKTIQTNDIWQMILSNDEIEIKTKFTLIDNQITILEKDKLGFDHAKIIFYALNRLRNKLEYTNIAFSLLGKKFTMAELQQIYEVILDKKLIKANFQRKIKDKVESTDDYKLGGFRPARLYQYKK